MLDFALRYLDSGIAPIPLWPDKRKNPKLSSFAEFTERLPTAEEVRRWWGQWPTANIGLITGYWRNLVCLDFDELETYDYWFANCAEGTGNYTWTVTTGRGVHVWYQLPTDPGKSRMYTHPDGFEVLLRAKGGYCIAPPSIHWTGKRYKTLINVQPLKVEAVPLDGWMEKALQAQPAKVKPVTPRMHPNIRIEDIIQPIGRPSGRGSYKARCPFHQDDHPSAWVNVEQQRFGCNACWPGQWWDVVNLYAMIEGISNNEAYKQLATIAGGG